MTVGDPRGYLKKLSPGLRHKAEDWLRWAFERFLPEGWGVRLTSGLRTEAQQEALWSRGRKLDMATGKWVIVDRGRIVTYCDGKRRRSFHQDQDGDGLGDAFDWVLTWKGKAVWYPRDDHDDGDAETVRQLYSMLCDKLVSLGLVSGIGWKRPFDPYHAQMKRRNRRR